MDLARYGEERGCCRRGWGSSRRAGGAAPDLAGSRKNKVATVRRASSSRRRRAGGAGRAPVTVTEASGLFSGLFSVGSGFCTCFVPLFRESEPVSGRTWAGWWEVDEFSPKSSEGGRNLVRPLGSVYITIGIEGEFQQQIPAPSKQKN